MAKRKLYNGNRSKRGDTVTTKDGVLVAVRDTTAMASLQSSDWMPATLRDESLLVKGEQGPPGESIVGPKGADGANGKPGADAEPIVPVGEWNRQREYPRLALVLHENDSWIAREPNKGREPSDRRGNPWQLVAKSIKGESIVGPAGQRGRRAPEFSILAEEIEALQQGHEIPSAIAEVAISKGDVVYIRADNGNLDFAQANALATSLPVGIAIDDVSPGQTCRYVTDGQITFSGWNLSPGVIYFLSPDTPGALTASVPDAVGEFVIIIGTALTQTSLKVEIHRAYSIG